MNYGGRTYERTVKKDGELMDELPDESPTKRWLSGELETKIDEFATCDQKEKKKKKRTRKKKGRIDWGIV